MVFEFFTTKPGIITLAVIAGIIYIGVGWAVGLYAARRSIKAGWTGVGDEGTATFGFMVIWPIVVVFIIAQRWVNRFLARDEEPPRGLS